MLRLLTFSLRRPSLPRRGLAALRRHTPLQVPSNRKANPVPLHPRGRQAQHGRLLRYERLFAMSDYYADFSRIRTALGWEPRIPLRDGLARTLAFYRENLEHYL